MRPAPAPPYLLGLIGSGIKHSLTPPMHEQEAACAGLRCLYLTIDLDLLELPDDYLAGMITYARLLGFRGLNITHPCKQAVLEYLDGVSPEVAAVGAANTVLFESGRGVGYNTDVYGFRQSFIRGLPGAKTEKVVLLGAGGAGSAVAEALLGLGVQRLVAIDPDQQRLQQLGSSLAARYETSRFTLANQRDAKRELRDACGLVNATPVGMSSHPGVPIGIDCLHRDLWVADIVYLPMATELLRVARRLGCRVLNGGGMAVFQAARAFELFTGRTPDINRMLQHFDQLVTRRP
ncbi:MAG: shikimate dehydrogenase [Candidatus Dormibacteraceae bacterium]